MHAVRAVLRGCARRAAHGARASLPSAASPTSGLRRRNYIHVMRHWGPKRAAQHIPDFAQRIVAEVCVCVCVLALGRGSAWGQGGRGSCRVVQALWCAWSDEACSLPLRLPATDHHRCPQLGRSALL